MPEERPRFLLGHGHRLTSEVRIVRPFDPPDPPYTLDEAKARVAPMVTRAAAALNALPAAACPEDYAVSRLTIHPQYTAKSYFPVRVLQEAGLESIGSRPTTVIPDKLRNRQRG